MKPMLKTDITSLMAIGFGALAGLGVGAAMMEARHDGHRHDMQLDVSSSCVAAGQVEVVAGEHALEGVGDISVHRFENEVRIEHVDDAGGPLHMHCVTVDNLAEEIQVRVSEEMDARRRRPRRVELTRIEPVQEIRVRAKADAPRVEVEVAPRP